MRRVVTGPADGGGSEVTLGPGDTVVQQGTPHDWRNRGTEPCVMVGVMVSTR